MKIELPFRLIEDLKKDDDNWAHLHNITKFQFDYWDSNYKRNIKVDTATDAGITIDLLFALHKELKSKLDSGEYVFPIDEYQKSKFDVLSAKLAWHEKNINKSSDYIVKKIADIPPMIEAYFTKNAEQEMIFFIEEDYGSLPYLLTSARFYCKDKYTPEHVALQLTGLQFDKQVTKNITIYSMSKIAK
jgi:hypothetical protein